jgi:2-isopropylmalate synthase
MPAKFALEHFNITSGDAVKPSADIKLRCAGKQVSARSSGDGPVDACYKAIDKITGAAGRLLDYQIRSVTGGKDALGEVSVKIESKGKVFSGRGASTDVIEASIKAYINAVNKMTRTPRG